MLKGTGAPGAFSATCCRGTFGDCWGLEGVTGKLAAFRGKVIFVQFCLRPKAGLSNVLLAFGAVHAFLRSQGHR